ncbi:MAG: sulfur carrier protein ThiS [Spirochaetes bacterium]|nr:sulfur carrier protein ThiS [Spirochaetota bacterium]
MKLCINYKEEIIEGDSLTVKELLELKDVKMPHMVSVQLNGKIVKRPDYDLTYLGENDRVNFLYSMGGG